MGKGFRLLGLGLLLGMMSAPAAWPVPTEIIVRVKTKDAKFLGTNMGGALVTIKDAHTGEILAKGRTAGSTGSNERIMETPHQRGVPLSDETSAKFFAVIDLEEPRLLQVEAMGPMSGLQAANRVSSTQWVLPGKHITAGDGWMLEMPGFAVKVLSPSPNASVQPMPNTVNLRAYAALM